VPLVFTGEREGLLTMGIGLLGRRRKLADGWTKLENGHTAGEGSGDVGGGVACNGAVCRRSRAQAGK
jgi:hypothetical protein